MEDLAKPPKVMTLIRGLAITIAIGIAISLLEEHEVSAVNGVNGTSTHGANGLKGANGANGTSTHGANGNSANGADGTNGDAAAKSGVFLG